MEKGEGKRRNWSRGRRVIAPRGRLAKGVAIRFYEDMGAIIRSGLVVILSTGCALAEPVRPDWIWRDGGDRHGEEPFDVTRILSLPAPVVRAVLRATADFSAMQVALNGETVLSLDPYDPPEEIEVGSWLRPGENRIAVSARGVEGPSAFALSLEVTDGEGAAVSLATDASWPEALAFGEVERGRWELNRLPEVSVFAEYNQWKEALASPEAVTLSKLPPGFQIEKVRDAAEGEGSWVSLTFDSHDRIYLGMEEKGILRLTLSDDGKAITTAEKVEETLRECRGLAWQDDVLYAHANNAKALYALRDSNGDGRFEEPLLIHATEGGSGHGRNALTVGPDKRLHAIVGDDVSAPDRSPRRVRPESGAPRELGHWVRLGAGKAGEAPEWEVMNRGLRNPYGLAFNPDGEAFTYDADNEGDVGLPFYRPSRINHLVPGANYGWHQDRGNTRNLPVHAPETVPTTYDVGRGSPTGVEFGTRSRFPSPWREALFALDWAYGRILAIHLAPHGASYHAVGEVFLEGRPLNVTDLEFDGAGAMWFVTGGRKTKSALYRVSYVGPLPGDPGKVGRQEEARRHFSETARATRRGLEQFHGATAAEALPQIRPFLGSPDPWIRNAARVALEWQPVAGWRDRVVADEGATLGGLTAMLALARAGGEGDRAALARIVEEVSLTDSSSRAAKLTLLRVHELVGAGKCAALSGLRFDSSGPVRRELARALVRTGDPDAVDFALGALASAAAQVDRLHYLEVLSEAKAGWGKETRELYFTHLAHAASFSRGDRFLPAFFQTLGENALSSVGEPERAAFAARLGGASLEEEPVTPRAFVAHWTVEALTAPLPGTRDLARGRELYTAVLCAKCHVHGTVGRPVGPDLATVARRFSRRDLLEAIVEPSAVVSEAHRHVLVSRRDGTQVTGRIVQDDFRESTLTLATNAFVPSELVVIPKAEILSWEESPVSPMPPALLDSMTREEVEDLIAFLLTGSGGEP